MNIAVIGAGNRARKYLGCLPEGVHVRCLVEPDPLRLRQTAARFGVPADGCFSSPDDFFAASSLRSKDVGSQYLQPEQAPASRSLQTAFLPTSSDTPASGSGIDAVIIAAPDRLHVPLALRCVERGWPVLLEKPAASSESAYRSLLAASERKGVPVALCLEMRFHPYFQRIKELTATLGQLREIDHTEHIGPDRMAHTFVRGLWSRRADAGPIFLSKCCHDADFIFWITGAELDGPVRSRGERAKFRASAAPSGAAYRCIDCPLASSCAYSAVSLYLERGEWTDGFDIPDGDTLEQVIRRELASGRYGRCVYHCDNNVYDTQEISTTLTGGITLRMRLEGTSLEEGRATIIKGTAGTLVADGGRIHIEYADGRVLDEDYTHLRHLPLHAGADEALVRDFFVALAAGRTPAATLSSSFAAHRLCFLAG
ncbi:MAG: Gfo/Idh/MocA family oxidoreductase [Bacteroidota bacterium]|nr:Gfo/Idh/MocA family oxidoreductase [Bacteroidota bacterium]